MSEATVAQRDVRRVWEQLERLFDWAGTRNTPMAPANLAILREQVTTELTHIIERADALEQVPLLREVKLEDDGMRSVTIDMRDGKTRTFQTRVDWFDTAPGIPESVEALIAQAQAEAEVQKTLAAQESARAESNTVDAEKYENAIRDAASRAERAEADLVEERQLSEMQSGLLAASAQRETEYKERIRIVEKRLVETTQRAERVETTLQEANTLHQTQADRVSRETERANLAEARYAAAEAERVEWRSRWLVETKALNEALPPLAQLLVERTASLEALEKAAEQAKALLGLKRFEKDEKAAQVSQALADALSTRSDRSAGE
jgi:hypothetical protein